jgi:hypothetical protein
MERANNIVILIHGTWPRKQRAPGGQHRAAWCEEASLCRSAVRAAFGESVDIRVFEWLGANSPDARLAAADRFNEWLEELHRREPAARLYVIAHSHAGNVVLYAAQRSKAPLRLCGAVFLSTPFLHVMPRILGPGLGQKLEVTVSLALMFLMLMLYALVWPAGASSAYWLFHSATWKGFWLTFVSIGLTGGLLAHYALVPALRALHRSDHTYAQSLKLPHEVPFPVLIIRGAGDEAAGALGATHLVSHLASRVLRAGFRLVPTDSPRRDTALPDRPRANSRWLPKFMKAGLLICVAAIALMGLFVGARAAGMHPSHEVTDLARALVLLLFVVGVLVMAWEAVTQLLIIPPFLVLSIITAVPALAFGWRFAWATFGLDISAESTPPGRWTSFQLEPSREPYENRQALSHATHSDPAALHEMTVWLRELNEPDHGVTHVNRE